ncbi:restriction endonuclease, partial [Endozoicomonas ascidiicola]|uniref:restriction endonuclease n=1 Tax=Endozoicomonas ascidiicola TaxID=1698521 RepID=UPI001C12BF96
LLILIILGQSQPDAHQHSQPDQQGWHESLSPNLFGVMAADDVPFGVFATSSSFNAEAENFAAGKNLKLISGAQSPPYFSIWL